MDRNVFYVIESLCNGCEGCLSMCSLVRSGSFSKEAAHITVVRDDFSGYQEALVACDGSPCGGKPVCAEFCPTGALLYGTAAEVVAKKRELLEARRQGKAEAKVRAPWAMRR